MGCRLKRWCPNGCGKKMQEEKIRYNRFAILTCEKCGIKLSLSQIYEYWDKRNSRNNVTLASIL